MKFKGTGVHNANPFDEAVLNTMAELEVNGSFESMLKTFDKYRTQLSSRAYWGLVGVLWHRCHNVGPVELWRARFSSKRTFRHHLMRPDEQKKKKELPDPVIATQLHEEGTEGQEDGIGYLLNRYPEIPKGFVLKSYRIAREDVVALFDRIPDQEAHVIVPRPGAAELLEVTDVNVKVEKKQPRTAEGEFVEEPQEKSHAE